ncbi:hypothetical protein [Deinococcus ruber]|uniref:ATPase dynein-related AAA domain-containing protein n=1 Tax=Deinococcus ruber TaxID=1848197 RepID=A0A918FID9_9DEIO|nr:hypothetical protein [Deinococcus ruber]GGR39447.1 hypothetical protein GCM10008957_55390 [Deinococcus ruber]
MTLTVQDLDAVMDPVGYRGIPSTLHRIRFEKGSDDHYSQVIIRVGRVISGVAECLRGLLITSKRILVIGPPAVGQTTLLQDIARIRGNQLLVGFIVINSANELTGDGSVLMLRSRCAGASLELHTLKLIRASTPSIG